MREEELKAGAGRRRECSALARYGTVPASVSSFQLNGWL
jgi:hypothetical protein